MIFTARERIDADGATVWRYLSHPNLMADWMPGIDRIKTRDGAPVHAGSELVFHARGAERKTEVSEFMAQDRIALCSTQGPFTATYRYSLRPDGAATEVSLEADCVAHGLAKLIAPLVQAMIRRADSSQLEQLKKCIMERRE